MTKEEKAVLEAAHARMDLFMLDGGYKTYAEVIRSRRGKKGAAANLIRATARWLKSEEVATGWKQGKRARSRTL